MCVVMSGYLLLSNLACEMYICFCVGLFFCPGRRACRLFCYVVGARDPVPLLILFVGQSHALLSCGSGSIA
jgi:hypothetical protein